MLEQTQREILRALFPEPIGDKDDPRINILVGMVFDLLMEVEALREVILASKLFADYRRAYQDTAYLTHNSAVLLAAGKSFSHFFTRMRRTKATVGKSEPGASAC
jgi:hypothetical protein